MISRTPNAERILRALDPLLGPLSAPKDSLRARVEHAGVTLEQTVAGGGWVITFEDVGLRRAAETNTAAVARLDALTKLPNRLMLRERLGEALARLRRTGEGFALLLIDLDRFKPVNATLGHATGDALLEKVADRSKTTEPPDRHRRAARWRRIHHPVRRRRGRVDRSARAAAGRPARTHLHHRRAVVEHRCERRDHLGAG